MALTGKELLFKSEFTVVEVISNEVEDKEGRGSNYYKNYCAIKTLLAFHSHL